jgi:hypothetical protein
MRDVTKNIFFDFRFSVAACECEMGIVPKAKGIKEHTFHLYPKEEQIEFAYSSSQGLINVTCSERAVIPDLLSIRDGDVKAVKAFIERHGFLLPLDPHNDQSTIQADKLFVLINRLQATVSVISALSGTRHDYRKLTALTMYLLLTPQISVELPSKENSYVSCNHELGYHWNNYHLYEKQGFDRDDKSTLFGYYFNDNIYEKSVNITKSEYKEAMDLDFENPDNIRCKLMYLYIYKPDSTKYCQLAIDLLYHVCKICEDIISWNHKGWLVIDKEVDMEAVFDDQIKKGLMTLAKHTLKEEMDWNLSGITPSYDPETMTPAWRVDSLLAGLYFSLFYMEAKVEQYRPCVKCGKPFLIKTTSTTRKYCGDACRNAAAQQAFRNKNK